MLKYFVFLISLVCSSQLNAKSWDEQRYADILKHISCPKFANKTYSITSFGAHINADAKQNQTAINKAIKTCSENGGGKVVVPKGTWNTGAIRMLSNVNLVVKKGATLLFAFDTELYPLVQTRWEGLDIMNYSPCIYAKDAVNVAITGGGTIDGNGSKETWWPWCGASKYGFVDGTTPQSQSMPWTGERWLGSDSLGNILSNRNTLIQMSDKGIPVEQRVFGNGHGMRPQLINFYRCTNVLVENITMLRSPFWVLHPVLSKNITVRGCHFINNGPNGDGCDPESCEYVLIENCLFRTGDDCIAIKSGRNADGRRANTPSQNIIIRHCRMEDGHGGVVIGSEISGGARNIFAEDCEMDSPNLDRILRIKTNTCRGGIVENIYMRNVKVGQCREAVMRINLVYEPKERAQRGFIPTVRNIYMDNVSCKSSRYGVLLNGLEESCQIENINVTNCTFDGVKEERVRITGQTKDIHIQPNL